MMQFDRIPPQALDAEKTLLGTLLIAPHLVVDLKARLSPMDFYTSQNKEVYAALIEMSDNNTAVDIITVCDTLKRRGTLEEVGGECYIAELSEHISIPENINAYLKIIIDKIIRRVAISDCADIQADSFSEETPISQILKKTELMVAKIEAYCDKADISRKKRGILVTPESLKPQVNSYREKGFENVGVSLSKFWPQLAEHYRPAKGTVAVVTGIPTHGKSEMVDALMVALALLHGWKFGVYSSENRPFEMHLQKLCEKYLKKWFFNCSASEIDSAMDWIHQHFIFLEPDEDNINVNSLLNLGKEAILQYGLDGIVWDPWNELEIQQLPGELYDVCIGRHLSKIRRFAERHNILQIIVAHPKTLIKDPKTKKYPVPRPYDIHGGSPWYGKPHVNLCVYRNEEFNTVEIHVQKIKFKPQGKKGVVVMTYDTVTGWYSEMKSTVETKNDNDNNQTNMWQNQ
jgi:hypothetical protein